MSAGICDYDKGVVQGSTWHGIESYVTQDEPVSCEQAREVLDYPLKKVQLRCDLLQEDFSTKPVQVDAWTIIREDHNLPIVPSVGSRFDLESNLHLFEWIEHQLLKRFPDITIESVGTLWNGATAFINLKVGEMVIRGDHSDTINRAMWFNPLGKGAYGACAHSIRVVCNNTLTAAAAQGALNETLIKFRHTESAGEKINEHLENIAGLKAGMDAHEIDLNYLATIEMNTATVESFLSKYFGVDMEKASSRSKTRATNKMDAVLEQFESDQGLEQGISRTRYAMLQAVTYYLDHQNIKNGDQGALAWDGIVGARSKKKMKMFQDLMTIEKV